MKKFLILLLLIFLVGCDSTLKGKQYVEITVKDYGKMKLELDADVAPITVNHFIRLVKDGFYDGLTFHRIKKGFMIQGGDPYGNGTGGASEKIVGEFAKNGYENSISHVRGVISMARAEGDMDGASSQFFIVHKDSTFLDGNYAAFGRVIEGMYVVDKIALVEPDNIISGYVSKEKQPIIESIRVVSK